nr:MAG TPA: hypothetical protein [Caudoviricetes sp.]
MKNQCQAYFLAIFLTKFLVLLHNLYELYYSLLYP